MTSWLPDIAERAGPRYRAIVESLAEQIAAGRLGPGKRLPTHRDLAWRLGVTVGTVSRAYAEAERRGLVAGEVGRGTFVRQPVVPDIGDGESDARSAVIDLSTAVPPPSEAAARLAATLAELAKDPRAAALLDYPPHASRPAHRAAGAEWLARRGLAVTPDQVVLTNGGNHGVLVSLAAATRPGDRVLTESLSYSLVQPIARLLGLHLEGIATDREGLLPEAVEAACRSGGARALYCIPTLQNPTTTVMSEPRRRALAEVAARCDLAVLEDDIFALFLESPPAPIASFAPERTYYITSLSKTLAPGLRIGYVAVPGDALERVVDAVRASSIAASPIPAEIVSRWIREGSAERILASNRREIAARCGRVREILGDWEVECPAGSLYFWLHLPEPWRATDFVEEARRRGVIIAPAEAFAVGRREVPHAVRGGLGRPRHLAELDRALHVLAELLRSGPTGGFETIV